MAVICSLLALIAFLIRSVERKQDRTVRVGRSPGLSSELSSELRPATMKSIVAVAIITCAMHRVVSQCPRAAVVDPETELSIPHVGSAYLKLSAEDRALGTLRGSDDAPKNVSCAMRELAVSFADYVLGGSTGAVAVASALNVTDDCSNMLGSVKGLDIGPIMSRKMPSSRFAVHAPGGARAVGREFLLPFNQVSDRGVGAAAQRFVDAAAGNDKNDGSKGAPWATLARAAEWLSSTAPSARPDGVTINLAPGTYF